MGFEIDMNEFKQINIVNIINKKKYIKSYFKALGISISNLEFNFDKEIDFYLGPLKKYGGSMLSVVTDEGLELFIDYSKYPLSDDICINHELLHFASDIEEEDKNFFGHDENCRGIDEGVTEMFAEEMCCRMQSSNDSYLWFLANIMRVNGLICGIENLADQYLNATDSFERKFNKITNNKFEYFSQKMTTLYHLLRKKEYLTLNDCEELILEIEKEELLDFMKKIIDFISTNDINLYSYVINNSNDEFLSLMYGPEINNKISDSQSLLPKH